MAQAVCPASRALPNASAATHAAVVSQNGDQIASAPARPRSETGVPVPVTRAEGSWLSQRYRTLPTATPRSGATQNSQSRARAQPPTNTAGPVLRAGVTDRVVTGMAMRG